MHIHKRNPDFSIVVYVNNVHITVVHQQIHNHRGGDCSLLQNGKCFLSLTSVCVFVLKLQKEKSSHVEKRIRCLPVENRWL